MLTDEIWRKWYQQKQTNTAKSFLPLVDLPPTVNMNFNLLQNCIFRSSYICKRKMGQWTEKDHQSKLEP